MTVLECRDLCPADNLKYSDPYVRVAIGPRPTKPAAVRHSHRRPAAADRLAGCVVLDGYVRCDVWRLWLSV
eukprot:SAG11_NODE_26796_length_340_cov_1.721992_1_plen_71_part_00